MKKNEIIPNKKALHEAKVIFVGQGDVGKTSLIKKLVFGHDLNQHEKQTDKIAIEDWHLTINNIMMRIHMWDFGGQEIMHATHQFFLTERTLYVLVLNTRIEEDENRLEYWIKIIRAFGGENAPIILVGNKIDYQDLHIDRTKLQKKYPGVVREIVETSCLDGRGIDQLRTAIVREILNLPVINQEVDESWLNVKMGLEGLGQDFISREAFTRVCKNKGVPDEVNQKQLGELLHDIGVMINFQKDPLLNQTYILNPKWVTEGVYGIINSNQLFQKKGVIEFDKLGESLDTKKYPPEKVQFLIELMRRFELCYEFDDSNKKRYLVPALLEYEERYTGDWNNALEFEYHYDILPSSIITRFIVRMHPYIEKNTVWRNGVLLSYNGSLALVKGNSDDKIIRISILGSNRREFLSIIRGQIDSINRTFSSLEIREMVPIPKHPDADPVEYKFLLGMKRTNRKDFPVKVNDEIIDIRVDDILNLLETENQNAKRQTTNEQGTLTQIVVVSFYIFIFLIIFTIIAIASTKISLQVIFLAPIIGLLTVIITASVGLISIGQLSQDNFTKIISSALNHIPIVNWFFKKNSK